MKIKIISIFISLLSLLGGTTFCCAQDSFTASISSSTVGIDDRFQVTFTLNTSGKNFIPPSFKDFNVLSGPSQSSSMQFVNGSMSQSISLSYILQPKAEGTIKIGLASINVNGKTLMSNALTVTVVKGNKKPEGEEDPMKEIEKNLFIKASVNKTTTYQGEGISVTYKLFSRVNLVNINLSKVPDFNGFWNQEIALPQELQLKKETIDGVMYNTAEIKKMILFPQRSGTLQLDAMKMESIVRIQDKRKQQADPFGHFFNDPFFNSPRFQDLKYMIISKTINITVLPLPSNAPEGFSGAVGDFTMLAFIDKPETKTNEPVTLKIKISGKGNLKLINPVKTNFPSDIESYAPKTSDNITVNSNGVSGSRTFEYLLIPRHAGEFKISPILFSYFDPVKKKYVEQESPSFTLKVEKGSGDATSTTAAGINKEDLQLLGKDIRYIKTTSSDFSKKGKHFFSSTLYYTGLALPVVLFFAFLFYWNKQKELSGNTLLMKSKGATKVAKKRLTLAKKYLNENNKDKFYDEILKSVWGYSSDKLSIPLADLSKEMVLAALRTKNVTEAVINKYVSIIDQCEFARYAPAGSSAPMGTIYEDTIQMITQLEQDLK